MDWLENLSVMEIDRALVLTYFIRSSTTGDQLILRGSVMPPSADAYAEAQSVVASWPMAERMENEVSELFGIRFEGNHRKTKSMLPADWIGFPLRKSYVFPAEYNGILHARPVGQTSPDEFPMGAPGSLGDGGMAMHGLGDSDTDLGKQWDGGDEDPSGGVLP